MPLDDIRALVAALAALELEPPTPDAVLVAARVGAFATGRRLLERLQRYELSAPLDQLQAADKQEWWQAEDLLGQARMQITVLAALTGKSGLAQVATDSHSPAYARHRLAVEDALGRSVPQIALIVVESPARGDELLSGWIPPYDDAPWAVVVTSPLVDGNALDPTLLHELIHATQTSFGCPARFEGPARAYHVEDLVDRTLLRAVVCRKEGC